MKVLHVINNLGSGGAEKLLEETLPLMKTKYNIDSDVLLLSDEGNVFDQKLIDNDIKISVIPIKSPRDIRNIFFILKFIKKSKYDIVHSHLFPTLYWSSLAIKLMGKEKPISIVTEHNTENSRRNIPIFKFIDKFIYGSYNAYVSIGESTQRNLIKWLEPSKKELKKYTIINNGVNIDRFNLAEAHDKKEINDSFDNNTKLLCMVGRFTEQKDQATIIKSLKYVPDNVHLLLVGEGSLKSELEELSDEISVRNRVHFLGFRSDVERIMKTSDIIIQSSNWEGFGLTAAEGMAAGKPLIGTDVAGLREVIKGAAILFEVGNEEQLAGSINKLINDQKYYEKISNDCFERSTMYGLNKMVDETVSLYKNIIS